MAKDSKTNAISPQTPHMHHTRSHSSDKSEIWAALKFMLQMEYKRLTLPRIPWLQDLEPDLEHYYTDLAIQFKYDAQTRPLHLHEVFASCGRTTSPTNGFISHELKLPTRILIEGPAGYGKSTLARKLCFDHAKNKDYILHFELIIFLSLREFDGTLDEMIINTLQLKDYTAEQVLETIKQNQSKILFILDGFDELHPNKHKYIIPLLQGNQLPHTTVIITSRLGCVKVKNETSDPLVVNLLCYMNIRIIIEGIKEENRFKFLRLFLNNRFDTVAFQKLIDNTFYLFKKEETNIFNCPMFLLLLAIVATEKDIASVSTKTELYMQIFNLLLQRMHVKSQTAQTFDFFHFDKRNPPSYVETLSRFGSLAGEALTNGQSSLSKKEIVEACGNDNYFLIEDILTQTESKIALKRKTLFQPLHLSFLEFSFAYSIWVSVGLVQSFLFFSYPRNIVNILELLKSYNLIMPFLFGLCGKELPAVLSVLINNPGSWQDAVVNTFDYCELMTESRLTVVELAKAFLPIIPMQGTVPRCSAVFLNHDLLKVTLEHAVVRSKNQNTVHDQEFTVNSKQVNSLLLKVKTDPKDSKYCISQKWSNAIKCQNIIIKGRLNEKCKFTLIITEAPLNQQLSWLSNFMMIEGLYTDKPIHEIEYWCTESELVGTFSKIGSLIRHEKVVGVTFSSCTIDCTQYLEKCNEFIGCAKQSKQLLDMTLNVNAETLLTVDLGGKEGKMWRTIELVGDVVPRLGTQLCSLCQLDSFTKGLPSRIQTLRVEPRLPDFPFCLFVPNGGPSVVHNLCELRITLSKSSSLASCIGENLQNLKVLAIRLATAFKRNEHEVINSLLSLLSSCHHLVRLEIWDNFTEEFFTTFLQCLSKVKCSALGNPGQSKKINVHLETLMLSPFISSEENIPESSTSNLLKELLLSGIVRNLWVSCTENKEGYAKRDFFKSFAPTHGYTCTLAVDKNDFWQLNWLDNNSSSMYIFKISAN